MFEQLIILGLFCGVMLVCFCIIGAVFYGMIYVRVESFRKEVQDTKTAMLEMFKENSIRELNADIDEEDDDDEDENDGGKFRPSNRLGGSLNN